jgi:hypothetical protein
MAPCEEKNFNEGEERKRKRKIIMLKVKNFTCRIPSDGNVVICPDVPREVHAR